MAALQQHWKTLSVSLADAILTISMNRPKVNAMSIGLLNDLEQVFDHASKNDKIKGVHLRSNFRYSLEKKSIQFYKIIIHLVLYSVLV
jgi:1,4-dihydroxy-2-naphthoyl-CoA synthase